MPARRESERDTFGMSSAREKEAKSKPGAPRGTKEGKESQQVTWANVARARRKVGQQMGA